MSVAALAVFLREEMGRQNITQQQLEEMTGIPDSTLSRILNGEVAEPRASQIAMIGKALKVDFWILMRKMGIGNGPPSTPDEEAQEVAAIVAHDPNMADLMREASDLNEPNRKAMRAYARLLKEQQDADRTAPPSAPESK